MASKSMTANMQDGEGENSRMYGIDDGLRGVDAPASRVHRPTGYSIRPNAYDIQYMEYLYGHLEDSRHMRMAIQSTLLYLSLRATITTNILENAFRYLEGRMQPIPGEDPELEYAGAVDD
ncbi:hypothetical protein VE01_01978 [Pseudogymnoascus verrucosus]|uniref:Uncharacterized protein n=1 Tax=Pseudogymnoascus verrucosus TaxID=342668 RepID=A0A1B8GVE6_9PEZI|nr:uncharacterized protein VE01_01978 [Pseudogymnoascus verrucosus]OBT99788.1 hypothetical protein VE01_01978 [Pseudogymnoascus verrucosus]